MLQKVLFLLLGICAIFWFVWFIVGNEPHTTLSVEENTIDTPFATSTDSLSLPQHTEKNANDTTRITPVHVPILVYHGVRDTTPDEPADVKQFNISPKMLERQMQHLVEHGYTTIQMSDLATYFEQGTPLPEKAVILTFDDGWHSQYVHGVPILRTYGIRATFYLFPNALGHKTFMSWDQARELVDAGMEIGSHSLSHQYMTRQEPSVIIKEIRESREWLEEILEVPVTSFSYPYGLHNEEIVAQVEAHGYRTARDLTHTITHTPESRYTLGAYLVTNDFANFEYILSLASRATVE